MARHTDVPAPSRPQRAGTWARMHLASGAAAAAALMLLLGIAPAPLTAARPAHAAPDGEVLLVLRHRHGVDAHARAEARDRAGVAHAYSLSLPDSEVVTVPADQADAALASLNADPDVSYAEQDGLVHQAAPLPPFRVPVTDPGFGYQYSLRNTGQAIAGGYRGTPGADMSVRFAWNLSRGAGVTVAVADTGVDEGQPDLAGQLAVNPNEIAGNGRDDDGNGFVDDVSGWDFVDRDSDPATADLHGTHVAGIVAAAPDGEGTVGVAPAAKVMPLRVLGSDGQGTWDAVAQAFDYAGRMGVPIVNASLGGDGNDRIVADAMARHPDTLYVVAAGNDNRNLDGHPVEPCSAASPNVLCVGASDQDDARASFSNWSSTQVDVFAPGFEVYSTAPGGAHTWLNGTSMAAPNAAGVAALAIAAGATQRGAALKQLVMDHVDPKPALIGQGVTGGRVNALAVVSAVRPDSDGDGVADDADGCPAYGAGDDGCAAPAPAANATPVTPQPRDRDSDGVVDGSDRCPTRRGPLALDGCPPRAPSARASVRRRVVTLAVRADDDASLAVVVTRFGCRRSCVRRLRSTTGATGRATVTTGRVAPARYRVVLRASVGGVASRSTAIGVRVR